jgi:hypothetical protein
MRVKHIALLASLLLIVGAGCQSSQADSAAHPDRPADVNSTCGIGAKLVPRCGAWWGVAANPLGTESWNTALGDYETKIGRTVNVAHYYHRAGELFPTKSEIARATQPGKNRLLFINYKPEAGHTWYEVGHGATDGEIDRLAAYIKANFNQPFFLTVHHEPEEEVKPTPGSGFTAADYRLMYRHVMLRLYQRGLRNVIRVMDYIGLPQWGVQPWFNTLYPGDDVVDWIAYDPYIFGNGEYWGGPADLFNRRFYQYPTWPGFYSWATHFAPDKPLMLGEWGVAEKIGSPGAKANFFRLLGDQARQWPRVKAFVYWNSGSNRTVGATRVDSSFPSLSEFARIGRLAYFNP